MKQVVLATGNQGKIVELEDLLAPLGFEVLPQSAFHVEDAEETGLSFVENAIIKARHACAVTGRPALADDSGLAVDALQGAPGIYSARYAQEVTGEQSMDQKNIAKLLHALEGTPQHERGAAFHCVLVFMLHAGDPTPLIAHGMWHGEIATSARGEGGFGYDPVFYSPELGCTAAELSKEQKRAVSHRGKALTKLYSQLQDIAK
ncbi:RdgB/HAM1 family non-canonical purine NTP pyrophosphatase [Aliidiomarina celeris]|uniref:RdgB/HAM1 family non-canonical purine NTP pyrophosphatase n=1 Tax=Aliidiomarina celeris TaxID=2249428 RepID=UPI000DE8A3CE|nr:RdgB/HAM1 family non-canonical purine NTP pyrophosphatase [Aliidiomarina celeris]